MACDGGIRKKSLGKSHWHCLGSSSELELSVSAWKSESDDGALSEESDVIVTLLVVRSFDVYPDVIMEEGVLEYTVCTRSLIVPTKENG